MAQKDNISISFGISGMNRDTHSHLQDEKTFLFQMNGNIEDENSGIGLTNEHSNLLCSRFKEGYVVIGHKYDSNKNQVFFFLTERNPNQQGKRKSEIGSIKFNTDISNLEDIENECGCDFNTVLSEPLENQEQVPHCKYETIISDDCNNCLNFSPEYPIYDVALKQETCGYTMSFTDGNNAPRYIILDKLNPYFYTGSNNCGVDETEPTCLDCEKLRIFPLYTIPCLKPKAIQFGGRLKRGKYEFLIAYSDKMGNEMSPYFSLTYPISIFDKNNNVMDQTQLADATNMGIRLEVSNLDKRFNYYKIAVIQNADINGITSYFIEGVHTITDTSILYTSDIEEQRTTLNHIVADKPNYKTWRGLTTANNYLMGYGYTVEKEWNLQPVVNLMGSFLRWQTVEATEDLYANGINDSLYTGYMRDEVYPFGIRFGTKEGYRTSVFPLIGRPGTSDEWSLVDQNSNDVKSIKDGVGDCTEFERKYKWQYYNTASVLDSCAVSSGTQGTETTRQMQEQCFIQDVATIPSGSITINTDDDFIDLKTWIDTHGSDICDSNSQYYNSVICSYISDTYPNSTCPDNWTTDNIFPFPICTGTCSVGTCDTPILLGSEIVVSEVTNEQQTLTVKPLSQYNHSDAPTSCQEYKPSISGSQPKDNIVFNGCKLNNSFVRQDAFITNTTCQVASNLPSSNQFFNTLISNLTTDLVTSIPSISSGSDFKSTLHKEARWYKQEFGSNDSVILEVTTNNGGCESDDVTGDGRLRYTVYKSCTNTTVVKSGVFNVSQGLFLEILKTEVGASSFVVAFDAPILQKTLIGTANDGTTVCQNTIYAISPPCGCVNILLRDIEYLNISISFDNIILDKVMTYQSNCKFLIPELNGCDPVPHKFGKFSYWQSEEIYPDNVDLYDSSWLEINDSDLNGISPILSAEFKSNYVQSQQGGKYIWKSANAKPITNFTCEPIRHYKFPDNRVVPFMDDTPLTDFSENRIFPMGVTIDTDVITSFLDIAVKNGLITQEQRDIITDFELFRGDRSIHKSVIMKGIANDMYEDVTQSNANQLTLFRNFPYNTLGDNVFITTDVGRTQSLRHPYNSDKNNRFSLIAPEVYYNRPTPPTEVSIEGYMYGNSVGGFKSLEEHSEWVILGSKANKLADTLATAEVVFESIMNISNATIEATKNSYTGFGFVAIFNIAQIAGYIAAGAIAVANIASSILFKHARYRTQWLQIFEDMGNTHNFAELYVSGKGFYNSFTPNDEVDNKIRGLKKSVYLKPGVPTFTEGIGRPVRVNNRDREDSLYLSFGDNYFLNYPQKYKNYDNYSTAPSNASRYLSSNSGCNNETNHVRRIASPYFSLKNYVSNQYGEIDSVKWLSINHCGKLTNIDECKSIFGGDIKISRVDFKNKVPLFTVYALNIANRASFDYGRYSNMGNVRFYASYKSVERTAGAIDIPYVATDIFFDCRTSIDVFYERPPSKFYTHLFGVPHFLVESEINVNYRYAGKELHEQFASNGINVENWVQEKNNPIAYNNIFYYNQAYSKQQTGLPYRTLTGLYDKETWDCLAESPNGVVYSQQDNSEVSLNDPWLVFKPFDIYQFRTDYGKLISMSNIESQQVIARFENNMAIFNAVDVLRDRLTPETEELGAGGMFVQRPVQFSFTELGETGTQHRAFVSTEFGHFWVDAKRGKIFQLQPNGQNLTTISDFKMKGEESGLRKFFKKQLPFKILKQKIDNLTERDVDNNFKGLGILMLWDSKFKRVFITKKDYVVQKAYVGQIIYSGGSFYLKNNPTPILLSNPTYFKDVSWTISYSPIYQSFISFHDFKPDFAIAYNDYFQTGINYSNDNNEIGLWSHLLTNKSYGVFYGKKYPWEITLPIKNTYTNNVLQDVKIWQTSKRYDTESDYSVWRKKGFNKAIVYNETNNSGILHLEYLDSYKKSAYPKFISATEQGIPASHIDEQIGFNYFYNRVKKEESHVPIWRWDENEINKTLNENAISFQGKKPLERIRGDWFNVHLISDDDSRFKRTFKWMTSSETPYS